MRFVSLVVSLLFAPLSFAATTTSLRCGVLIDGVSRIVRKDIVIELNGDRISAVESYDSKKNRSGTDLIDLSRETCLPGLIDTHVHFIESDPKAPIDSAPLLEDKTQRKLLRALQYGFTTVRNLGSDAVWPTDVQVRKEADDGRYPSPRLKIALVPPRTGEFPIKGPEALKSEIDQIIELGTDWVKLFGDRGWVDPPRYSEDELRAMVDEAHSKGVKVAMHTIGPEDSRRAIACHVDSIEHGTQILSEDLETMHRLGIVYVPTPYGFEFVAYHTSEPDRDEWDKLFHDSIDTFERALKAHVKIAFGSDAGVEIAGFDSANPLEQLDLMVQHGMPPMDAIASATRNAAELMSMDKLIGTIEPGKLADIVATTGNPLLDIRTLEHVNFVMKGGRVIARQPKPVDSSRK